MVLRSGTSGAAALDCFRERRPVFWQTVLRRHFHNGKWEGAIIEIGVEKTGRVLPKPRNSPSILYSFRLLIGLFSMRFQKLTSFAGFVEPDVATMTKTFLHGTQALLPKAGVGAARA